MNKLDIIKIYILLELIRAYSETLGNDSIDNKASPLFNKNQKSYPSNTIEQEELVKVLEKFVDAILYSREEKRNQVFYILVNKNVKTNNKKSSLIFRRNKQDLNIHFIRFLYYLRSRLYIKRLKI